MRLKRWWVAAGVAGAALLSVQQVAQATLIRVNWSANTASEQTGLNGEDVRTAGVPISLSRDFVTRGGTAGITAEVDYGLVRFTAAAEGQASPSVSTFAGFLDVAALAEEPRIVCSHSCEAARWCRASSTHWSAPPAPWIVNWAASWSLMPRSVSVQRFWLQCRCLVRQAQAMAAASS